ncbi:type VI secretion protein IcmF/TssM N-terminal domain-containing protein [Pseudomonas sp. NPDC086278]|uniref:type VI secretion protein IcmF/TssM N-terminal domain-containing protein n=1 Tax=Pseudomonas sp. NPDC086278 TaxID=3390646 RepID=UPI003D08128D
MRKAWTVLLWIATLVTLALLCWGVTLYRGWPFWYAVAGFFAIVTGSLLLRWVYRRWYAWRLRARMQRELPKHREEAPVIDEAWTAGIRLLRKSRLGKLGSPLYVLPWFVMLGEQSSGKSTLMARCGLTSAFRTISPRSRMAPTDSLDWWFLDRGVVIDPSGRLTTAQGDVEWRRLLYWLLRSRRREPLNGVMLVINVEKLLQDSVESLAEQGQRLRSRIDDLVKVFGARLPVYFILTAAETLPGFSAWASALSDEQREQPFGLLSRARNTGAEGFLDDVFTGIGQRLFELRFTLGQQVGTDDAAFSLPERIAELRPRLAAMLMPAFDANPYSEPPLLCGLFLTGETQTAGVRTGWFSHDLFDQLLPEQRHAYEPLDNWSRWRRLAGHLAVILWLGLCLAAGALLVYADRHTQRVLTEALKEPPAAEDFAGGLDSDLDALRRFRQSLESFSANEQGGYREYLPFARHIDDVQAHYRSDYVRLFNSEVRTPVFDGVVSQNLASALSGDDPRLIAAYAALLVRRINLLDARLNDKPMDDLPLPGSELSVLYEKYGPSLSISAAQMATIGTSYRAYLAWQTDLAQLINQRQTLLVQLDSMGLEQRSQEWLTAWAEQQGNLPPVRLSEYWVDPDHPDVMISGAYTIQGSEAILAFMDELGRASRDQALWSTQRDRFLAKYRSDTQDAWYQFIQRFVLSAQTRLGSRAEWQETLNVVGTDNDPFLRLLHRSAERLAKIPVDQREPWAERAVEIDRLIKLASNEDVHTEGGALSSLKVTNAMGGDVLKRITNGASVSNGITQMQDELSRAHAFAQFQQVTKGVVSDLQKSDAQAFQVALDTWGFGSDPAVKQSALWSARDLRDNLVKSMKGSDAREDVIWALATGAVDFSVNYAAEVAACQLQRDWSGQLLSAVQGVQDPQVLNDLLYGEKGQLPAFLNGSVKTFIQRDSQRFSGREALGVEVPLTGAFYGYISRMQHAQNDLAGARRQSQAQQATELQSKQALTIEQKTLQASQADLQQKMTKLMATAAVVDLTATPSQVNLSARQLPRQTRLTLQCNGRSTVLDNYNFPTSATFAWAPGSCADVTLEVSFADFKLVRHWTGDHGFVDFLRMFKGGQHAFTPDDFPGQRDLMGSENLQSILLTYRQQGEQALMANYSAVDQLQGQLTTITDRLKAIDDQLNTMDTQAAALSVSLATQGSPVQQGLAVFQPPQQIAWCWTPRPVDTVLTAGETKRIEVGIFDNEIRLKAVERQLQVLGYQSSREPVRTQTGSTLQKLMVVGLPDSLSVQRAIREISRKLGIAAKPDDVPADTRADLK